MTTPVLPPVPNTPLSDDPTRDSIWKRWFSTFKDITGTVVSVAQSFTGGLISVAGSPITTSGTLALTVAGTSGGIVYFSGTTTWASSGLLAANSIILGGGAGASPTALTIGTQRQVLEVNTGGTAPQWQSWPQMNQTIGAGKTLTIDSGFSVSMAAPLNNQGTIANSGCLQLL